jgi:hypothetical protein
MALESHGLWIDLPQLRLIQVLILLHRLLFSSIAKPDVWLIQILL